MPVMLQRTKMYLMIKCFQLSSLNGVTIILDKTRTQQNFSYLYFNLSRDVDIQHTAWTYKNYFHLRRELLVIVSWSVIFQTFPRTLHFYTIRRQMRRHLLTVKHISKIQIKHGFSCKAQCANKKSHFKLLATLASSNRKGNINNLKTWKNNRHS